MNGNRGMENAGAFAIVLVEQSAFRLAAQAGKEGIAMDSLKCIGICISSFRKMSAVLDVVYLRPR